MTHLRIALPAVRVFHVQPRSHTAVATTSDCGDSSRPRLPSSLPICLGGWSSRAPSVTGSLAGSSYRFTANMDIDSAAFLRSSQGPFGRSVYGVTPTASNASPLRRRDSECSLSQRSTASAGLAGMSPEDADGIDLVQPPCGDTSRGGDVVSV